MVLTVMFFSCTVMLAYVNKYSVILSVIYDSVRDGKASCLIIISHNCKYDLLCSALNKSNKEFKQSGTVMYLYCTGILHQHWSVQYTSSSGPERCSVVKSCPEDDSHQNNRARWARCCRCESLIDAVGLIFGCIV